jgi:hypothetical protein
LVGDELGVGEVHAEDVGHENYRLFWVFILWVGEICADIIDLFDHSLRFPLVLYADDAASLHGVRCHGVEAAVKITK